MSKVFLKMSRWSKNAEGGGYKVGTMAKVLHTLKLPDVKTFLNISHQVFSCFWFPRMLFISPGSYLYHPPDPDLAKYPIRQFWDSPCTLEIPGQVCYKPQFIFVWW